MSLVELKAVFSALIFISGGISVLLPWALGKGDPAERFMACGTACAGGVLGGAGLIHLLSGGASEFRALAPGRSYPLAFVLAGAGFLLILLIEAVIAAEDPNRSVSQPNPVLYTLLLVLSMHSLIVGMALGAQNSASQALIVFIANIAHKMVAGFALGISYRRACFTIRRTAPVAAVFASMTPLGVLAGTAVEALISSVGSKWFEAIFDSVGAGTFLYIASVDIVRTEFEVRGDRWQK